MSLTVFSCTLEKKDFDNPVDFEANDQRGIGAPTIVFYPLTQTRTLQDSVEIFKREHPNALICRGIRKGERSISVGTLCL